MARSSRPPAPKSPAHLSPEQMGAAIPKLDRRIRELEEFDPQSVRERSDPRIKALEISIEETLVSIFGADTLDYDRYRLARNLDTAGLNVYGTPLHEVIGGLIKGKERAVTLLNQVKKTFAEQMDDMGSTEPGKALRAYEGLELHPEIDRACGELYRNGHHANAIEDAVKILNVLVRMRSGVDDRDGSNLMEFVFNPKNPVLRFNDLKDQSDIDEQKGYMMLFSGAVAGLRNPRAHKIYKDEPERALEFIAFISLLAKLLDSARKI